MQNWSSRLSSLIPPGSSYGAQVLVSRSGREPEAFALGKLEPDSGFRFPIYSVAKTLLALLALKAQEQGKISLDAPLSSLLVRPLPPWLGAKPFHLLLSHRSGLSDYGPMPEYHQAVRADPGHMHGREEFLRHVMEKGDQFPGTEGFFYSNVGYALVRETLEQMSGLSFAALCEREIFSPLGLRLNFLEGISSELSPGFSSYLSPAAPDVRGYYDFSWVFHGTYSSRLSELTELWHRLRDVVSKESLDRATALHPLDYPHPVIRPSYGLGFMGDLHAPFGPVFGHNGGGPGYSVAVYAAPRFSAVVAAVVNHDDTVDAEKLVFETLRQLEP